MTLIVAAVRSLCAAARGGKRRGVGMDAWAWEQLAPWLELRTTMPVGALLCVIYGPTRGRPWTATAARAQLRRVAARAGSAALCAPSAAPRHAVEMAREQVPLVVIQRQLGHGNLGITSLGLSAGHRQQRDHRHRARSSRADDLCQRGVAPPRVVARIRAQLEQLACKGGTLRGQIEAARILEAQASHTSADRIFVQQRI
ncbi:MAG: hypothetical protein LC790_01255 [Actinobacteria bacterium]|nr:hypothetical protein [Actinomycetota bacterium]